MHRRRPGPGRGARAHLRIAGALVVTALLVGACGAIPPARYEQATWETGWNAAFAPAPPSSSSSAAEYPLRFRRLAKDARHAREVEFQAASAPWKVSLASSGFLATAEWSTNESGDTLSADEREAAQRFLDAHLDLLGLTKRAPLEKWDDGLYYLSPVGDPRFGISVQHRGAKVTILGHLWPSMTLRSSARRSPADLLRPWLGVRVVSGDRGAASMPCDRTTEHPDACGSSNEQDVTTISPDVAKYVVYGRLDGDFVEVREVLVLPLPERATLVDARQPAPPPAIDARTGEPLDVTTFGSGMCEEEGACALWTWSRSSTNFLFWHWVTFERLQFQEMAFPSRVQHVGAQQ
jgi:hypothetical protein